MPWPCIPYVFPTGLAADPLRGWADVEVVRQIMVDHGDGDKKIWMTEFGALDQRDPGAEGVSQEEQASQITDMLWKAAHSGYSGPAFIFAIRDVDSTQRGNRDGQLRGAADHRTGSPRWRPRCSRGRPPPAAGSHIVVKVQP